MPTPANHTDPAHVDLLIDYFITICIIRYILFLHKYFMMSARNSANARHAAAEDLLREILRCSRAHQDWMERSTGVPAAELRVLRYLELQSPAQAGTMAEAMYLHPSTISNLLSRLQRRGWLTRSTSTKDRRARVFCLSARGLDAARQLAPYSKGFAHDVLRSAEPAQILAMTEGLAKLAACIPVRWRRAPRTPEQASGSKSPHPRKPGARRS